MERYWAGDPLPGIACCQQAITALERTGEDDRLGMAHFVLALNTLLLGDFAGALAAVARVSAIGEALKDRRLLTFAAWTTGWLQATRGECDAGIAACQRGLEGSSDPLNTAFTIGWLGYAYLEKGETAAAIPLLEQAAHSLRQFGYRRLEGLYTTCLAEAHRLSGNLDTARTLALQGLAIASETPYRMGVAWAQRTLGRIAQATDAMAEARQHLTEALTTFAAMPARFEVGRTHLALAELACHHSDHEAMTIHVTEAYHLFTTLGVPAYVRRAMQQARAYGLAFAPVVTHAS
jgi:tetratricopeptide (TPR) repeat protein